MDNGLYSQWERHITILRGLSPKSAVAYRRHIEEFTAWKGGVDHWEDITRQDVEAFLEHLFYNQGNGNRTRLTKLISLGSWWRFLAYEGIVKEDLTRGIPRPIARKKFVQDLSKEDRLKMFSTISIYSEKGLRDACMLILLCFAGLRVGELVGLRLEDIVDDGQHIEIQLPDDIVKQQSFRTVDLWKAPSLFIRQLLAVRLSHHRLTSNRLFVSYHKGDNVAGNALYEKDVDRFVKKTAHEAGVRKRSVYAHMFRASHAQDLRHVEGYDIAAIAERLGHKNISTTDQYLPKRRRVGRKYRSLRDYWMEWERIWTGEQNG